RLLIQDSVYDEVVERVVTNLSNIRVGDPFDEKSQMGPLIGSRACDRVLATIKGAEERGDGELLCGGGRLGGDVAGGFYVRPAAFGDVSTSSPIARDEIFGPVLSIGRFDDEASAIELANDTVYGLAAY